MLCRTRFPLHKMYQLPCKPTGIELLVYAHIKSRLPSGVDNHSLPDCNLFKTLHPTVAKGSKQMKWLRILIFYENVTHC